MSENIRALIVIVALAMPTFYMARLIARGIIADREFVFWRNVWFLLTLVAFLSTNFFIYAIVLIGICLYARSARIASVGLFFIMLFALPLGSVAVGAFGINYLLDLNNAHLLAIFLLVPILLGTPGLERRHVAVQAMTDRLVVGYVLLSTALELRNSEITNVIRVGTVYTLNVLIPYFALSRAITTVADIRKAFLAYVIVMLPLSLFAVFESAKGWHLYSIIHVSWGAGPGYLQREGFERAFAAAAGSISLGFLLMIAVGCTFGIWHTMRLQLKGIVLLIFVIGLLATFSRGSWVGTAILLLVYVAVGPNPIANLGKLAIVGLFGLVLLLTTPVGSRVIDFLPFIGSVENENVTYRQMLFDKAIVVIQRDPWFGNPDYRKTREMLDMENGQHIIDIVNTYLEIGMRYGLVVLSLFLGVFVTILAGLWRILKFHAVKDTDFNTYVRASIATLVGILLTIATLSSGDFIQYSYWSFAGLCVALIRVGYKERSAAVSGVHATRVAA